MQRTSTLLAVLTVLTLLPARVSRAQAHPSMPAGMTHEQHMALMKARGDQAMGFDQDKATHHFRLTATGGAVEVGANDAADLVTRDQIRAHLKTIAAQFADGVFEKPEQTHAETPPGVTTMQARKASIGYAYEEMPNGGRVRITTSDAAALAAVHDFLRYQIREHATGDPLTIQK